METKKELISRPKKVGFIGRYLASSQGIRTTGQVCEDYINDHPLDSFMKRKKVLSKDQVIVLIQNISKIDRKLLNHKILVRYGLSSIVYSSCKHFGTWNKAIIASGVNPLYNKWTAEKVILKIKKVYNEWNKVLNSGELRMCGYGSLVCAAVKYWGGWSNALREAGLRPYRNNNWTNDSLILELRRIVNEIGFVPSKRELHRLQRYDLVSSGYKHFKGYNNFLKAAGFNPVLVQNIWTKEKIIKTIQSIAKKIRRTPTEKDMVSLGLGTVVMASLRKFKGWNKAVINSGLLPNENCVEDKIWKEWENFVMNIYEMINPDSIRYKQFPNKSIPDLFIPKQNMVVEIKTNASDTTIHSDVNKYEPYCNKIEIWYLKGFPVKINNSKVVFRGPKYMKSIIKNDGNLMSDFQSLLAKV